jgi:UDP-GlcNAc:undecaprenyl-phosphate/decaprenyl-phosphate GlcNAc-1-phosphate transferase
MSTSDLLLILPAVATAFAICYLAMPVIIKLAGLKNLIDAPDQVRKSHAASMPTLGGVGIFSAFIISYSVWGNAAELTSYPFFIAALFTLFLVGVRDDILMLDPVKKLIVQIAASILVVVGGNVVLTNFGGVFGLHEIPWIAGVLFSVVVMVAIINAFNLIDGIDGLAGGVGVIVSSIFGIWFWGAGFLSMAILSFSLTAALIGFLTYNMHPARIFMGDTGAMAIGFILGFLALNFLTLNSGMAGQAWYVNNAHVFAIAALIVPIIDTVRVMVLRSVRGHRVFGADRSHMHHKLIDTGISHEYVSFSLWLANIFVIGLAYSISFLEINVQMVIVIISGFCILPAVQALFNFHLWISGSEEVTDKKEETRSAFHT